MYFTDKWFNDAVLKPERLAWVVAIGLVLLCGKATAFEELGKVDLPPLELQKQRVVGQQEHYLKDGKPYVITIASIEDGIYQAKDSEGCEFSARIGTFAPTLSWKSCSGHTGSRKIYKSKGKPYPLKKKTKFSFKFNAKSSNGDSWSGSRLCKARGGVRIRTSSGEYDTHKLVCVEGKNTRNYYLSGDTGDVIAFKRKHKSRRSLSYSLELVEVVRPG